jgi:hypothetical protein
MSSLEYIDKQILFVKQNIQYHKDLLATVEDDESIEIIKSTIRLLEPDLQTLQQIKTELEAWYVAKEKVEIIETVTTFASPSSAKETTPTLSNSEPVEIRISIVGQDKIKTFLKALEVE